MEYIIRNKIKPIYIKKIQFNGSTIYTLTLKKSKAIKGDALKCITILNEFDKYCKNNYEIVELKEEQ